MTSIKFEDTKDVIIKDNFIIEELYGQYKVTYRGLMYFFNNSSEANEWIDGQKELNIKGEEK